MSKGKKVVLSADELAWLKENFADTKNIDCAEHLGISMRTVNRVALRLGLTKSAEFKRRCQHEMTRAADRSHRLHGTYPPKGFIIPNSEQYRYREGETPEQRLGKERNEQRKRKAAESLAKTRRGERARATFGLPQRTKLRVIPQPRAKVQLRYYLKKRGYIVDDVKRIVYYDENTRRGKRIEAKPQRWYKFEQLTREAL